MQRFEIVNSGHAETTVPIRQTAMFILGTALVLAELCTGLFALFAGTGLALSMLFDGHNTGS
jgi:membrane-bound ClpP family serine protease